MERPTLRLDLHGPDGNIFVVMEKAQELLTPAQNAELQRRVLRTHTYEEALRVIAEYVDLVDGRETYFVDHPDERLF